MLKPRTLLIGLAAGIIVAGLAFLVPANIRKTTDISRGNGLALPGVELKSIDGHGYVLEQGWDDNSNDGFHARCMAISTHKTAIGFPFVQQEVRGACSEDVKHNNTAAVLNFLFWVLLIGLPVFSALLLARRRRTRR